ncbi:MAG: hypothetical protein AAFY00_05315 [Bacteroidota bacterium]
MKKRLFPVVLLALVFIFSCTTPKFVTSEENYPKVNLGINLNGIIIEDLRQNVSLSDDLEIPVLSRKGQYDIAIPPLKNSHKNAIRETILYNLSSKSSKLGVMKVQILKARKEFAANSGGEKETSFIELAIIINIKGKETTILESGEFYKKSIDATYKRSERIYTNALKEVTYRALQKLKENIESK